MKILYRYEIDYKTVDNDTGIILREYPVLRETANSYFINHKYPYNELIKNRKRVPKLKMNEKAEYANRFAYIKKKDARIHFERRTMKRIAWYEYWKKECEKALKIIDKGNYE